MSFADTLVDDVNEPVNAPDGLWRLQVISGKYKPGAAKTGEDVALITFRVMEPIADVSTAELDARGPVEDYSPVFHRLTIFDKRTLWDIKKLALMGGLSASAMEGIPMAEVTSMLKGLEVFGVLTETYIEGRDDPLVNISGFAPAE